MARLSHIGGYLVPDTTGPVLTALSFQPSVDLRSGTAPFTMSVHMTDESAITMVTVDVDHTVYSIFSPGNPPSEGHFNAFVFSHDVVTVADRDFQDTETWTLTQNNANGTYTITGLNAYDALGNFTHLTTADLQAMGFATSFTVQSHGGVDVTAPTLTSLTFPAVDVRGGFARYDFAVGVSDAESGVKHVELTFDRVLSGPAHGGDRFVTMDFYDTADPFSGGVAHLMQGFQGDNTAGPVTVTEARVTDNAGNVRTYTTADLRAQGIQTTFEIASAGVAADTTAPRLTGIQFPSVVDVRQAPFSGPITVGLTDPAGVESALLQISGYGITDYSLRFEGRDGFADGSSTLMWNLPTSTLGGLYTVSFLTAKDYAGNTLYSHQTGDIIVLSNAPDLTRPHLTSLDLPDTVELVGGQASFDVTVGAAFDAPGPGVHLARLFFKKDGEIRPSFIMDVDDTQDAFADGMSTAHAAFGPRPGHYELSGMIIWNYDASQQRSYQAAELKLLGYQTGFDIVDTATPADPTLSVAVHNVLRAPTTDPLVADFSQKVASGALTMAQAQEAIIHKAATTTSVATLSYAFFTGRAPSEAGMDYLVAAAGPNPNNLNAAYYQGFNLENRYINFAVNLGKAGEGRAAFAAEYGAKDLFEATRAAYGEIFGAEPSDAKLHQLLDPIVNLGGVQMTRAEYFAGYGGDGAHGQGTKAAMVGWLLAEAVKADVGTYAKVNDAFLMDLMDGAAFGVDIVGAYNKPEYAYTGG